MASIEKMSPKQYAAVKRDSLSDPVVPEESRLTKALPRRWFPHRIVDVVFMLPQAHCYVCGLAWETSWLMGSGPMCGCE